MPLPTIFLALGPPTLLEQPSRYSLFVRQLAARLPKPKAIVLINPLWEEPVQRITGGAELLTFHKDEPAASRTVGDIVLSLDLQSCFAAESIKAEIDDRQGLDDAPWMLLRLLDRHAKLRSWLYR